MTTINATSPILVSVFSTLVADHLWTTLDVSAAVSLIVADPLLDSQMVELQSLSNWGVAYNQNLGHPSITDYYNNEGTIVIQNVIGSGGYSNAEEFVGYLSYEVGHAEDQQEQLAYSGTDLAVGADVAAEFLGEGKALVNNILAEQTIFSSLGQAIYIAEPDSTVVSDIASHNLPQAIIDGADSEVNTNLLSYYWDYLVKNDIAGNTPSEIVTALKDVDASVDANDASGLTISQNTNSTDSMTLTFGEGTVQSYIVNFGGYGSIVPSTTLGGQVNEQVTTTSVGTAATYQEFIYTNGSILIDLYSGGQETLISSHVSEILIGHGTFAAMEAGGSLDTLIDMSGLNSTFEGGTYSSLTEIALDGSAGIQNTFSFSDGTNVLIGDAGNNTFIENPTVTSATNIIWGGGGESTYSLTGVIDILTTTGTANAAAIVSLVSDASQLVPEEFYLREYYGIAPTGIGENTTIVSVPSSIENANMPVSEIVDPTSNDVLAGFAGIYTPQYDGPGQDDMGTMINFLRVVGDTTYAAVVGLEYGDLQLFATNSVTGFSETAVIYNFVNRDLGITFSGSTNFGLGSPGTDPYPGDSEGIYNFSQLDYIDGGTGNSIGSGGGSIVGASNDVLSGNLSSGVLVGSGGNENVLSNGTTEGNLVTGGGVETVLSGGSDSATTIQAGGLEVVQLGGTEDADYIQSGGMISISSGGIASSSQVGPGGVEVDEGIASGGTVTSGGSEVAIFGGQTEATVVQRGGSEFVSGGSIFFVSGANGYEEVLSGGISSNTVIQSGGVETILGGALGTIKNSGAVTLTGLPGGLSIETVIQDGGVEVVLGGGVISGIVIPGGITSDSVIQSGGVEVVLGGAVAAATTVDSGGVLLLAQGASATSTDILSGGIVGSSGVTIVQLSGVRSYPTAANNVTLAEGVFEYILDGGKSLNPVISGGEQVVLSGGEATSATVSASGTEYVYGGATTNESLVNNGGTEYVLSGGTAILSDIVSGGTISLQSGGMVSSTTFSSGYGVIAVGGTATSSLIGSGGQLTDSGGFDSGTVIQNGGTEIIIGGGIATAATISSGATQTASLGGTASSAIVKSGGVEFVSRGGQSSNTTIKSGGIEVVYSGGSAAGTTVNSGGELILLGGVATSTTSAGGTIVSSGVVLMTTSRISAFSSIAGGHTVSNGQSEYVLFGGLVLSAQVKSGSDQVILSGGQTNATSVSGGGSELVANSGIASATMVLSGGVEAVSGGAAYASVISAGGQIEVSSGSSTDTQVESGGYENISLIGIASASTISNGGTETVYGGGIALAGVVLSGGVQTVSGGGSASDTTVASGGSETLSFGGFSLNSLVQSGGVENVQSGGNETDTTVMSNGSDFILAGGSAEGTSLLNGGVEYDYGSTSGATVSSGGDEIVENGGIAFGIMVDSGGQDTVSAGGTASQTTIMSHANEFDFGTVVSAIVNSGSGENVLSGGYADGIIVDSGADDYVGSTSTAVATSVLNGGNELDYGTVVSAIVFGGGVENVLAGGFASGVVVSSGGLLNVLSGGTASGAVISGGGSETVANGGTLTGSINFAGSNATLAFGESSLPANVISGFDVSGTSDEIVLSDFEYVAGSDSVTLETGNTLRLNLGGTISTLYLDPAQSFAGDTFNLTSNSQGQVVILDPPNGGHVMSRPSGIAEALRAMISDTLSTAARMTFLTSSSSENGRSMEQASWLGDPLQGEIGSFLGSYSDTAAQLSGLSGTSVSPITVSASQPSSVFSALTNQSLQSGRQVSTYVHSGFA